MMVVELPSEVVVERLKNALRDYLAEVDECAVADLDVTSLAHHLTARLRAVEAVTVEPDPTPPTGIARPAMLVYPLA